jgi:aspartate/methionine/tyrosine aminotransferase
VHRAATSPTLTVQELEAAHRARFDLGPAYPQLAVPDDVQSLYRDPRVQEAALHFPPVWTAARQFEVDEDLEAAAAAFLSLDASRYTECRVTFSGSVALNRALSGCLRLSRHERSTGVDVVTTTPSVDIMRLFLEEYLDVKPIFVPSRYQGIVGALDAQAVVRALYRTAEGGAHRRRVVLLTSPENPTGSYWSAEDLRYIGDACAATDAILVVDHSLLLAGVHSIPLPRVWDHPPPGGQWIALWDTGKTFGLNEDKLGFIFSGDRRIARFIGESLAVMQFDVARRQKLIFAQLLRCADALSHIERLRKVCQANLSRLEQMIGNTYLHVQLPTAGSMALVDVAALGHSDEEARQRLLHAGVGVVAGNVFFHDEWKPHTLMRLALARVPSYFEESVSALLTEVARWSPMSAGLARGMRS